MIRKNKLFHRADLQKVFDPPHYELFTLRDKVDFTTSMNTYHEHDFSLF